MSIKKHSKAARRRAKAIRRVQEELKKFSGEVGIGSTNFVKMINSHKNYPIILPQSGKIYLLEGLETHSIPFRAKIKSLDGKEILLVNIINTDEAALFVKIAISSNKEWKAIAKLKGFCSPADIIAERKAQNDRCAQVYMDLAIYGENFDHASITRGIKEARIN